MVSMDESFPVRLLSTVGRCQRMPDKDVEQMTRKDVLLR